jgi:rhomboid family GlyGly-CTERM serine protease
LRPLSPGNRFATPATLAWAGLALLLAAAAVLASRMAPTAIDWQPALASAEPWRALSAVAVHYSRLHLVANLAGAALVAALGVAAQVPARCVVAWCVAWPLTQFGLLLQPALTHYGGLSGVLHAGVAVVATELIVNAHGARRGVAVALLAGLVLKVGGESPWSAALRHPAGWDIAVAPLAHASGLVAGVACAAAGIVWARARHH